MIIVLYNLDTQRIISHPTEQSELTKPTSIRAVELEYINTAAPSYDSVNQVATSEWITDLVNLEYRLDWTVRDKTEQELTNDINAQANIENSTLDAIETKQALQLTIDTLPEEQQVLYTSVYAAYKVGISYLANDKIQYEGLLYKIVQSHTSQLDWPPTIAKALYVRIAAPNEILPWVQPTGAHDAYLIGARVTHNGYTWDNIIDNNVWEPGIYSGWINISPTTTSTSTTKLSTTTTTQLPISTTTSTTITSIPVWKQPTGAGDAYNIGDKVHFPTITDPVYKSLINANTWSPVVYPAGWALV